MKLVVAIVLCLIAYLCVTMEAWEIWPPMGKVLLGLLLVPLLVPLLMPEAWFIISDLRKRRRERKQVQ
jgi:hypothetical protein